MYTTQHQIIMTIYWSNL